MPFIPHTDDETNQMLKSIGVKSIENLFAEIPKNLRVKPYDDEGLTELEISQIMIERANMGGTPVCFAGGGAYDHHIPAAVWQIATRGEFYSAYTPYQAEASQGTLQLLYEFQTMMSNLMQMDVSNTSLYDGASGLAEAVLMAVRTNKKSKSKKFLIPKTVNPRYRETTYNIVKNQGIELIEVDFDLKTGLMDSLEDLSEQDFTALIISNPNYFGKLEDIEALTDWAHNNNILVIAVVNPILCTVLKPPGEWGKQGVDIACGEAQTLGIPLSSGGPYLGFMCCKKSLVRQMPGRIIGKTEDVDGNVGFSLSLQAREQHIRRSKATSNICTNQGLMTTAATIFMSIMGEQGIKNTVINSYHNTHYLANKLCEIPGVELAFSGEFFNEVVLKINKNIENIIKNLALDNIVGGINLTENYPQLGQALLVCATEKRTHNEIDQFKQKLEKLVNNNYAEKK